jgi:O-antigen/teichoic acid export membrane protein
MILLFGGIFSYLWGTEEISSMLHIYIITTILLIPCSQFNFIQQANFDFRGIFWGNFARQGTLFAYVLFSFISDSPVSLISLSWVQVLSAAAGTVIAYFFTRPFLIFKSTINWTWVKKLFHFGKYVFGTNVSSMFFKGMDQLMLGYFIGPSSVAVYNSAVRVSNLVEVPTSSVASVVFPKSAERVAKEGSRAAKYLYERSVALILTIILPASVFILLFPQLVITLVAGKEYAEAADVLQITILYSLFIPPLRQFGTALDSIGKPKLNFYFLVFCAVLNFGFNYLFINLYGTIGAAYGTLVSYSIIFVLNQWILYNELKVNILNIFPHSKDLISRGYRLAIQYIIPRKGRQ